MGGTINSAGPYPDRTTDTRNIGISRRPGMWRLASRSLWKTLIGAAALSGLAGVFWATNNLVKEVVPTLGAKGSFLEESIWGAVVIGALLGLLFTCWFLGHLLLKVKDKR